VIVKEHPFPVYLTSCSALSSDHLTVLIETACRSSFQHPPDRPDFRRTDWANFQGHLEDRIPFDPELHNRMAIGKFVENFSAAVLMALAASTPKFSSRDDPRPPIPAGIQDLVVPLFDNQIRAQTASFDSKLAHVRKPLVRQLSRYLR